MASAHHKIECSCQPLDVAFHPQRETIVAAALVDGTLEVHDFQPLLDRNQNKSDNKNNKNDDESDDDDDEDDTIVSSTPVHSQVLPSLSTNGNTTSKTKQASCRAVQFSNTSPYRLYTGGRAGDLCCLDAERLCTFDHTAHGGSSDHGVPSSILWRIDNASLPLSSGRVNNDHYTHNPLHVLHQLPACSAMGPVLVSGDDRGGVRLWDDRLCNTSSDNQQPQKQQRHLPQGCVASWKPCQDYISAMTHSDDGQTLLAASADGTLSVFDLRKASSSQSQQAVMQQSDPQDDELLSIAIMKSGSKVVCGTHDGVLAVWSWKTWGDVSDRYPLLQGTNISIDAILKVDERTMITGSSDGLLRVVSIHPDKLLGVLGDCDGFAVEQLHFNATSQWIGSVSHDRFVRLWDASILYDNSDEDDDENEDGEEEPKASVARVSAPPPAKAERHGSDDEWEDMDEPVDGENKDDSDDSDGEHDSDSDDSDDSPGKKKKPKTQNDERQDRLKSESENFFSDL